MGGGGRGGGGALPLYESLQLFLLEFCNYYMLWNSVISLVWSDSPAIYTNVANTKIYDKD